MGWTTVAIVALLRVMLAGVLLLFAYPLALLPRRTFWTRADRLVAAYVLGLFIVVETAYLTVPLHLFEAISLFLVMITIALVVVWNRSGVEAIMMAADRPLAWVMTTLDRFVEAGSVAKALREKTLTARRLLEPRRVAAAAAEADRGRLQVAAASDAVASPRYAAWAIGLLAAAAVVAAVITRMTDALTMVAPTFSDYLEHLQWAKALSLPGKGLFFQGVYPRGMNAVLATLRFLSQEEPHTAMRVAGPLLNLIGIWLVWYVVRTATGSKVGALVTAALLAGAPAWLPSEFARQTAALPQEFAMGLIFPAVWWGYRYLCDGDPTDRFLAAAATCVVGGSHWIVLLYLGPTFVLVTLAALASRPPWRRVVDLTLWVGVATIIGLAPQGIALALGQPLLQDVAKFAGGDPSTYFQPIRPGLMGVIAVGTVLALSAAARDRRHLVVPAILVAFLALYFAPYFGLKSVAVAVRSGDFLALAVAATVGAGYAGLERLLGGHFRTALSPLVGLALVGALWVVQPPKPIHVPPQITAEMTTQVLRIRQDLTPSTWLIVGRPETLALALGGGGQMDTEVFLRAYAQVPPPEKTLARVIADEARKTDPNARPENVQTYYFFVETDPWVGPADRALGRQQGLKDQAAAMVDWLQRYGSTHEAPEIWYQSKSLMIYAIHPPKG